MLAVKKFSFFIQTLFHIHPLFYFVGIPKHPRIRGISKKVQGCVCYVKNHLISGRFQVVAHKMQPVLSRTARMVFCVWFFSSCGSLRSAQTAQNFALGQSLPLRMDHLLCLKDKYSSRQFFLLCYFNIYRGFHFALIFKHEV